MNVESPPPAPNLADSPVRRVVGKPSADPLPQTADSPAPDSVRELAFFDRINDVGPPDQLKRVERLSRVYDADYAILSCSIAPDSRRAYSSDWHPCPTGAPMPSTTAS